MCAIKYVLYAQEIDYFKFYVTNTTRCAKPVQCNKYFLAILIKLTWCVSLEFLNLLLQSSIFKGKNCFSHLLSKKELILMKLSFNSLSLGDVFLAF